MRRNLVLVGLALSLSSAWPGFGQATYKLQNLYSSPGVRINAPVFEAHGVRLEGTNYLAELYGGALPESLVPAMDDSGSRIIVGFESPGYFSYYTTEVFVPSVIMGGWAWLQVRAWDGRFGRTYEDAAARGLGAYGESPLFYAQGGVPGHLGPGPQPLIGLQSFRLRAATGVLLRAIRQDADQAVVEWYGGFKRYQVLESAKPEGPWQNLGEATTNLSATIKIEGPQRWFRVVGLLE